MDSLTHCVAGGLTPLLFQRAPKRTALVVFGMFAGELPDIDAFFGSGTPEGLMLIHRGLTHALIFQPFLMLAYVVPFFLYLLWRQEKTAPSLNPASLSWGETAKRDRDGRAAGTEKRNTTANRVNRQENAVGTGGAISVSGSGRIGDVLSISGSGSANGTVTRSGGFSFSGQKRADGGKGACIQSRLVPSLGLLCVMALCAQVIHIFLDSVTTFGTRIFLPFSSYRVDLPGMFIVDFFLLVPLTVLWVWALRSTPAGEPFWSRKSRWIARIAMGWLLLYPLANIGMNHALVAVYAKEHGVTKEQVSLFTEPFTPFVWKKIVWEGERCTMQTVFPFHKNSASAIAVYRVPDAGLLESFSNDIPLFATFREFAPTLVLTDITGGDGLPGTKIYRFADVRYITSPQSPARSLGFSSTNFGFEVKTSHDRVVAYRYLDRLEEASAPWVAVTSEPYAGEGLENDVQTTRFRETTVPGNIAPAMPMHNRTIPQSASKVAPAVVAPFSW